MADKESVNQLARKFENIYGTDAILKVAISTLNNILVAKGIILEDDLQDAFLEKLEESIETLNQSRAELE